MPNWSINKLTIYGSAEEIKRFKDGLLRVGERILLLQSYIPCPQKLIEQMASFKDIGYETFFNPDPEGYLSVLELPKMKKRGIKTREQLMEVVRREYPHSYENGLMINNNLFEFGYRNSYWWCIANWGTKWEVSYTELNEESPTELILGFNSAWSPAWIGICQIAALFPDLDFSLEYWSEQMDFEGSDHWSDGELVEHHFESPPEIDEELDDGSATLEDIEGFTGYAVGDWEEA
jgi:hypothetical protein